MTTDGSTVFRSTSLKMRFIAKRAIFRACNTIYYAFSDKKQLLGWFFVKKKGNKSFLFHYILRYFPE
jgi:hypothetical protein